MSDDLDDINEWIKNLERFKVESGQLLLTDPCYELGTWCTIQVPAMNGTWITDTFYNREGRVSAISAAWVAEKAKPMPPWEHIDGEVGVDSGQAGIFDLDAYPDREDTGEPDDESSFYGQCCKITASAKRAGNIYIDNVSRGYVARSGYGDGGYDAFAIFNEDRIAEAVKIVFIN
jgi:hypothetical protein